MPLMTHQQIHELLAGVAAVQRINGDVFAQSEHSEHSRFSHSHYVAALHEIAGAGDPAGVPQLLACMILARMAAHPAPRMAQNEVWELAQVRRLFPD